MPSKPVVEGSSPSGRTNAAFGGEGKGQKAEVYRPLSPFDRRSLTSRLKYFLRSLIARFTSELANGTVGLHARQRHPDLPTRRKGVTG